MSGKRGQEPADNPWVRGSAGSDAGDVPAEPAEPLPPSPWSQEVPPPPDRPGSDRPGSDRPGSDWAGTAAGEPPSRSVDATSGRRPRSLLVPAAAGVALIVAAAIVAALAIGGDGSDAGPAPADPTPGQSSTPVPPPPGAIEVGSGVSVVPVAGWSLYTPEKNGRQLIVEGSAGPRAWFWVRQKTGLTARDYVVRIVEGQTSRGRLPRMSNIRVLTCPGAALVECSAISYSMETAPGARLQGFVEAYRRSDGLVTAIDFITRLDFAGKAYADAAVMKTSVIESL